MLLQCGTSLRVTRGPAGRSGPTLTGGIGQGKPDLSAHLTIGHLIAAMAAPHDIVIGRKRWPLYLKRATPHADDQRRMTVHGKPDEEYWVQAIVSQQKIMSMY
jgi:hypothetical protein